ncbi:borealin-like [Mytilus trossulus]|uniref:borealin-like n=1 Tax=Mytilus trossulus TaxID=6551 RepID=UPI003006429A
MPRKKAKASTRAKPVLPDGNEGDTLSEQEKQDKLDAFLEDLDSKVIEKKSKLEKLIHNVLNHIEACYTQEIKRLPLTIRHMKLSDFIALGGTVDAVLANPDICEADDDFDPAQMQRVSTVKKACAKSRLNSIRMYDTISEEGSADTSMMASTKKKTGVKKARKGKNSSILANISNTMPPPVMPPPPSSAYRNGYFTPVNRGLAAAGWDTPMITPKFDPRLPVTPTQMRDAKPGEQYMSLGGSPIRNPVSMMQKVLRDQPELLQQFKSPDRITDVLSALSDIIGKAKENGE